MEFAFICPVVGGADFPVRPYGHDPPVVNGNGTVDQDAPLGVHRDDMAVPQDQVDPLSVHVHVCLTQVLIDR